MSNKLTSYIRSLESGFFAFWIKKYRVSFLLLGLIILYGAFSTYTLPKESNPEIEFGIVGITTIYDGASPQDVDNLITDKIEDEIRDISSIKKMSSSSRLGVSSITIELNNGVDIKDTLVDINDKVDRVSLPSDAEDPNVFEIDNDPDQLLSMYLYGDATRFTTADLIEKARGIQDALEGRGGISKIEFSASDEYEIRILLERAKIENLSMTLSDIASKIRAHNKNQPIGNYSIGALNYDFRFAGEFSTLEELRALPLAWNNGSLITLGDVAKIHIHYLNESISQTGQYT